MSTNPLKELYEQALGTLRSGDDAEAGLICRRALSIFGRDPNILCLLGEISLQQRRPQEASKLYSEVLERHTGFARALEGKGLALLADKKPGEACKFLAKAAAAAPKRSKTRIALARALAGSGRYAESEQAIKEAFALNPGLAELNKAEIALSGGELEEAEKLLRDLLARDPDNVKALRMLAIIAVESSHFKAARKMIERALKLRPGFIPGWNDLANLHMKQDRYEKALEAVQNALELDPQMAQTWIVKGNILTRAQRHEESLDAYRHALKLNPLSGGALSQMGHVLKTSGGRKNRLQLFANA